uniref:Olfactory receptor n=1 Tax=Astatotilapia calliptera TaxID=8154 RepID=A0A3P8Q2W7_ASTCA
LHLYDEKTKFPMSEQYNDNYEKKYFIWSVALLQGRKYVFFFVMFTLYILIICTNSTILYLIWIHKNLHEPMYIFIAALLLNSVLYSTTIYPKLLTDFLSEIQVTTYSACLFQFFMFYTLGCSEFLLLAAMAYDRYVAISLSVNSVLLSTVTYPKLFVDVLSEKQIISISACRFQHFMCYSIAGSDFLLLSAMAFDRYVSICKPLKYPVIMRQTTINTLLFLSWFVPGLQIAVLHTLVLNNKLCNFTLKGILCNNSLWKLYCESPRATLIYGLVVMLSVVIFPVFFILFTYAKIFLITYRSSRAIQKKAAETCLPHLFVLSIFTTLCAYDVIIGRLELDFPKTAQLIMTLQVIFYNPLLNPFIYGLKMKEISKHLKRKLKSDVLKKL